MTPRMANDMAPIQADNKDMELMELETQPNLIKDEVDTFTQKKAHVDALGVGAALKAYWKISLMCSLASASA